MDRRHFLKGKSAAILNLLGLGGASTGSLADSINWSQLLNTIEYKKNQPLRLLYPQGCLANLKPIIQIFEQLTGVDIEVKEAGFDSISSYMLKTSLLGKTNNSFDLAIPPTFAIPDLAGSGVIANLDAIADKTGVRDSIQSLYRHGDEYKGNLYGLQSSGDTYLLFLKKSWLLDPDNQKRYQDIHGYPLSIPLNWEELDQQMRFFHSPEKNQFGGCMFRSKLYMHWEFWIRMHAQGIYPFNRSMEPLINSPEAANALRQMKQANNVLHPTSAALGPYENFALFGEGNCYANLSWGGGQKYFNSANSKIRDDLIITQTPGIKIGNKGLPVSYFNWGWSYVVSSSSQQSELAFLFILLATSTQYSGEGVAKADGFFDPFLTEHFSHQDIENVYGRPFLDALKVGLEQSIPDLYMVGQAKYFAALKTGLQASLYQNVPVDLSLQAVSDKWNEISENHGIESQVKQWQRLQSKYPSPIKAKLRGF